MTSYQDFAVKGKILMLALDHRGSFNKFVNPQNPQEVTLSEVIEVKREIIEALYDQFSGVLIDPDGGAPAFAKVAKTKAQTKPYLLCIEKTGYEDEAGARKTQLQYSVSELHRLGARGIKLLLYYHPNSPTREHQLRIGREVLDACQKAGLPLFLEIVTYPIPNTNTHKPELVLDSITQFLEAGIRADVFKLEYPGDPAACFQITKTLGKTPWILLTRGDSFPNFRLQLQTAVANGCQGFLAGRALWQEFGEYPQEKRHDFFQTVVKQRFAEIAQIASR